MIDEDDYVYCHGPGEGKPCPKKERILKKYLERKEWPIWICENCEGKVYGQKFVNWIKDRISVSTSGDPTSRFVLRELVQNADDAEAEILILKFKDDALYVYNNGFAFRSKVKGGPGDFERISTVLSTPKEEEAHTSGNFGSGFQTVYLFTNYPEVHSHNKSFRYDPTVPKKIPLYVKDMISSPYIDENNKGAVFKLPWRKNENAIVKTDSGIFFSEDEIWKRWDSKSLKNLYNELNE